MEEDEEIRELHDAMVPVELSFEEFWCRYFFRKQEEDKRQLREAERRRFFRDQQDDERERDELHMSEFDDEDEDTDDVDGDGSEEKLSFDGSTRERAASSNPIAPSNTPPRPKKKKSPDMAMGEDTNGAGHEGIWLLRAARDAERRAAAQWRKKARDLHHELHVEKQARNEEVEKVKAELETQYQSLCEAYESKMLEVTTQIDDARATGYDAGIRESEQIIASMRQSADEELEILRAQMPNSEGGMPKGSTSRDQMLVLKDEQTALQKSLESALERVEELEQQQQHEGNGTALLEQTLADLKKEMELWRMRALKMKKLKDLIQTELNTVRSQSQAAASGDGEAVPPSDEVTSLRARVASLEFQLAETTAKSQVAEKEAYDRGVIAGRAEGDDKMKLEVAAAFERGVATGSEDSVSEIGLLKAELAMFRAFHESAAQVEIPAETGAVDDSLDDISLADGIAPCSPGSSVSIFTGDFGAAAKPSDDWGEW